MITESSDRLSGEILFEHPWTRKDLMNIGSLIESPPLYKNLTAFENLKVRATLLGIGKINAKKSCGNGLTDENKRHPIFLWNGKAGALHWRRQSP